jgi:hypothetical protein
LCQACHGQAIHRSQKSRKSQKERGTVSADLLIEEGMTMRAGTQPWKTFGRMLQLLLAAGCSSAGASNAADKPAASRATEADGSCAPEILLDPVEQAGIPDFAQKLADAYCNPSPQACEQLHTPQPYTFDEGDYTIPAPARSQWFGYCQALVADDPSLCEHIDRESEPNLQQSCEYFFQGLALLPELPSSGMRELLARAA